MPAGPEATDDDRYGPSRRLKGRLAGGGQTPAPPLPKVWVARKAERPARGPCSLADYGSTVSSVALVAVPSAVVIVIFPATASAGTVKVTSVGDEATTTATTVPTLTTGSAIPVLRLVPLTTTWLSSSASEA